MKTLKRFLQKIGKKNEKENIDEEEELTLFEIIPDEILVEVFKFLSAVDLLSSISSVSKRFNGLYPYSIHTLEISGKLRSLPEDKLIKVIRKFEKLEKLKICNNGSLEDYQITNSGLIQLAHKYIYHNAFPQPIDFSAPDFGFEELLDTISLCTDSLSQISEQHSDSTIDDMFFQSPLSSPSKFSHRSEELENGRQNHLIEELKEPENEDDDTDSIFSYNSVDSLDYIIREIRAKQKIEQSKKKKITNGFFMSKKQKEKILGIKIPNTKQEKKRFEDNEAIQNSSEIVITVEDLTSQHENSQKIEETEEKDEKKGSIVDVPKVENTVSYGLITLRYLDLTGCAQITDFGVKYLTFLCNKIETLCLRGCTKLTSKGIEYFKEFKNLKHLDLGGISRMDDKAMETISQLPCSLQKLDITFCRKITNKGLVCLGNIGSLEHINLQCCIKIGSLGIFHLLKGNPNLKHLNLAGCSRLQFCEIEQPCPVPNLSYLNCLGCANICDECLVTMKEKLQVKNLKKLSFAYCSKLTDYGVKKIVEYSTKIEKLNLKKCYSLSHFSIKAISKNLKKSLKSLNLMGIDFNMIGLLYIKKMKKLEKLNLSNVAKLNNISLRHITRFPRLENLDISNNDNISYEGIKMLCSQYCQEKQKKQKKRESIFLEKSLVDDIIHINSSTSNISRESWKKNKLNTIKLQKCPVSTKQRKDLERLYPKLTFSS